MLRSPFATMRARNVMRPAQYGQQEPQLYDPPDPRRLTRGLFDEESQFRLPEVDPPQENEGDKYMNEILKIRGQGGQVMNAYKAALANMPKPDDYKPGVMTRIAAGLSGMGAGFRNPGAGVETAMKVNRSGYENALNDYSTRLKAQAAGAELESQDEETSIKDLSTARALGLKYDQFKLQQQKEEREGRNQTVTANAAMARAKAYAESVGKPDYLPTPVKGGVLFTNKKNPRDTFTVPADTIAAANLKVNQDNAGSNRIRANAAVTSANASATNAETNRSRGEQYSRVVDSLVQYRKDRTSGKSATTLDQKRATDLALQQMYMDPDFRHFITSQNGFYDAADPDQFDGEEYKLFTDELNDRIDQILRGRGGK